MVAFITGAAVIAPVPARAEAKPDEPIIVTARREGERLQDIPLHVTVVAADDIGSGAVDGLQSLAARVPGLTFEAIWGGANSFPVLRGQNQPSVAGDAVGMFVDGVYQANRDAIDVPLLDLERIEVVHGPQSALFGHSTFAGLISYVVAQPTEAVRWSAAADLGTDRLRGGKLMFSGPVNGLLKSRLAANWGESGGTWSNDAVPGQRLGSSQHWALAGTLATRNDAGPLSVQLSGRFSQIHRGQPPFYSLDYRHFNCGGRDSLSGAWSYYCGEAPVFTKLRISPGLPDSRSQVGQAALRLAWDAGDVIVRSDTSFYSADARSYRDFDASFEGDLFGVCLLGGNCTPPGSLTTPLIRTQRVNTVQHREIAVREYTQELRIEGGKPEALRWMAGATVYWTRTRTTFAYGAQRGSLATNERLTALILANPQRVGALSGFNAALADDPAAIQAVQNDAVEKRRTLGAFAKADWTVLPDLTLRGEIRGNWQRLELDSRRNNFLPSFGTSLGPRNFFDLTGRIGLAWQPDAHWLVYASHARGSRSGGINAAANLVAEEQTFAPETNWTSELGARLAGGGLLRRLEITGYHVDWANTQIIGLSNSPGVTALIQRNTRGITVWGVDFAADLRPFDWLGLSFAGGYANPRFKPGSEDPGATGACGLTAASVVSSFCTIRPSLVNPSFLVPDISGKRVLRTAKLSWSAEAQIAPRARVFHGARLTLTLSHQGNVFDRNVNGLYYGRNTLLGARLMLPLGTWSLNIWGTNLTNQSYIRGEAGRPPFFYPNQPRPNDMILGDRRRIGLTVRIEG